jgi:DNA-binding NarL/FixJ family response regulator
MKAGRKIKVLIADDKEVLRLGLRQIVSTIPDCQVIAETRDGPSTLMLSADLNPDLIFIKTDLPLLDGVRTTQRLKKRAPGIAVIMLLTNESEFFNVIHSGADGYIMRETPEDLVAAAIDTVCSGGAWIGPLVAKYLLHGNGLPQLLGISTAVSRLPGLAELTPREKDVLRLLVKGLSNQKMANSLMLKLETIKVHMRNINKKLKVNGRAEIISRVLRSGEVI